MQIHLFPFPQYICNWYVERVLFFLSLSCFLQLWHRNVRFAPFSSCRLPSILSPAWLILSEGKRSQPTAQTHWRHSLYWLSFGDLNRWEGPDPGNDTGQGMLGVEMLELWLEARKNLLSCIPQGNSIASQGKPDLLYLSNKKGWRKVLRHFQVASNSNTSCFQY